MGQCFTSLFWSLPCFGSSLPNDSEGEDQNGRPGSSSTPLLKQNYEVFLSFRWDDTRRGFIDYLYQNLDDKGIAVFRDNDELPEGEKIDLLLEAIKVSKISVPIISADYASSMWCLRELLQIMECKETSGQLVLPIFYKVEPSDVRDQKGVFGEKFRQCRRKHHLDGKLVQDLQNAFKRVASTKGWESDKIADGHEGALVKIVVRRIFNELKKPILSVPDLLVGVDEHNKEMADEAGSSSRKRSSRGYDVFLNFFGPDSRDIVYALYDAFLCAGVRVFCHDESIEHKEVNEGELMESITNSSIYIPIFSKNYASSRSCLRELEKIMECWEASKKLEENKSILPIFYDVDSMDDKLKAEVYTTALQEHEKIRGEDVVKRWQIALQNVADIKGWDVRKHGLTGVTELIAEKVCSKLWTSDRKKLRDDYVGIAEPMEHIKLLLDLNAEDVRFVAIYGIEGMGKTTLARHVFNNICSNFQGVAFLSDICEKSRTAGIVNLQKDLLSQLLKENSFDFSDAGQGVNRIIERLKDKKVLIVLDDVESCQLSKLADDRSWFHKGSRIVITTRIDGIMPQGEGFYEYKMQELKPADALKLFSKRVFGTDLPPDEYDEISKVVETTGKRPLAINIIAPLFKYEIERQAMDKNLKKEVHKDEAEAPTSITPWSKNFEVFLNFEPLDSRFTVVDVLYDAFDRAGVRVFYDDKSIRQEEEIEVLKETIMNSKIYIPIFSENYASSGWCLRELEFILQCCEASQKQGEKKTILPIFYDVDVGTDLKLNSEFYAISLQKHKNESGEDVVKPWEIALKKVAKLEGLDIRVHGLHGLVKLVVEEVRRELWTTSDLGKKNYEVFLSFRGEDTRYGFTDHLYHRLFDKGIKVFRDNEKLQVGEKINQLLGAIKASKISVPIISPNYASSRWCLKELLQIIECNKTGQLVLPIFYKVKPSDVRNREGVFGENFRLYKEKNNLDEKLVQDLQNAFEVVTSMKGLELDKMAEGYDGALVNIVVRRIFNEVRKPVLSVPDLLLGVDEHIEAIKEEFDGIPSNDAKIIVIHGMGGIGKTTLAKVLYNEFSESFEYQSFVPNIREVSSKDKGMEGLQRGMISNILVDESLPEISHVDEGRTIIENSFKGKRLLLLLDDVNDEDQLDKLAGKNNLFDPKSIVIITTRNKNVVEAAAVNLSYELNELNYDQSYKLFCKHAFGLDASCPGNLKAVTRDIVSMTGGLPLAIEVIGSLLHGKGESFWRDTKEKLRRMPNGMVRDKLKISYDALEHEQQQIFLDIACPSHVADSVNYVSHMWKSCNFYPGEAIQVLISLSLIKVLGEDHVVMHDQLKDLGKEIVRNESRDEIGQRSRIWLQDEATAVIEGKQGNRNIQALVLEGNPCESEQFEGMDNLRFLRVGGEDFIGDFENLIPNLRLFHSGAHFNRDLVAHLLPWEPVRSCGDFMGEYWEGWSWSQMKDLKVIKLVGCNELTTIPDLSALNELEFLDLSYCRSLKTIHPSIGKFRKTLKYLSVTCCEVLEELPPGVGEMEELRYLDISHTHIKEIPISDGYMRKLETLYATGCEQLRLIPDSIGKLELLTELYLGFTGVTQLPDSIGYLYNLKKLLLHQTPIKCFPTSFGKLSKLQELDLEGCWKLESLSNLPCNLSSLEFNGISMETLADLSKLTILRHLSYWDLFEKRNKVLNVGKLNQLESLQIMHSWDYDDLDEEVSGSEEEIEISNPAKEMDMAPENFTLLPDLPSSLVELEFFACQTLRTLSSLSNLKNLSRLKLNDCSELMEINMLEGAESLTELKIEGCGNLSRLGNLSNLKMLTHLVLKGLEKLNDIEGIEGAESLTELKIEGCGNLSRLGNLSNLKMLTHLVLKGLEELSDIEGIEGAESLTELKIEGCINLSRLGNLSNLKMLTHLVLKGLEKLSGIEGIEKLTSLIELSISGCNPSIKFPDLSMLRNLKMLKIKDAELIEIPWLQELKSLGTLQISSKLLQYLPDLSHLTELWQLDISDCEKLIEIQGIENMKSLKYLSTKGCTALRKLPDLPNVRINSDDNSDDWA